MPINNKTNKSILNLTLQANEAITAYRFVDFSGNLASDNEKALGTAEIDYLSGEYMSIAVVGVSVVETVGAITKGANIASAAVGKARTAAPTDNVVGRALDTCSGADFIRVLLVP
jgi:hypothetical protein